MTRMRPFLAGAGLACALGTSAMAFDAPHQNQLYEIKLPEYDLFGYTSAQIEAQRAQAVAAVASEYGGRWHVYSWNPQANTPQSLYGSGYDTAMPMASVNDVEAAGRSVLSENASALGITNQDNLRFVDAPRGKGKVGAHFQQTYHGLEVVGGRAHVIFTDAGRAFVMGSDYYGGISVSPNPSLALDQAIEIAKDDVPFNNATDFIDGTPDLVVLPVPTSETSVEHHLVWRIRVNTSDPLGIWVTHVDAHSGRIVYRYNDVHFVNFTGHAQGDVQVDTYCNGETADHKHSYMNVSVSGVGSTTTNINGDWTLAYGGTDARTTTAQFNGPYCNVNVNAGTDATFSGSATPGTPFTIDFSDGNSRQDERDTFQAVSDVHDLFEIFDPGWSRTNSLIFANVNVDGSCNAFFSGNSINFYPAAGGCANTGEIQGVVQHEYGHAVQSALLLGSQGGQGLGEGNSDVLANILTQESIIGRGFNNNCSVGIRDSKNTLFYPDDVVGQGIHDAGRVIAGFHWDAMKLLQEYMGDNAGMLEMANDWHYARKVARPQNQPAQVLAVFIANDDDGNLDNGTPWYDVYCEAADNHGFTCPPITEGVLIVHNEAWTTTTDGNRVLTANITSPGQSVTSATLYYQLTDGSGTYTNLPMTPTGGGNYSVTIPSLQHNSGVRYYIDATDNAGNDRQAPGLAPLQVYDFDVAQAYDAFEAASGWVVNQDGTDNATQGVWVRADPIGSPIQPEDDTTPTPGVQCWVTGQGPVGGFAGQGDIDFGKTTLYSPTFDMSGASQLVVKYWKSFSNNTGTNPNQDPWIVQVRNNGGAWIDIENTLTSTVDMWESFSSDLLALIPTPGNLQFRFQAEDNGGQSQVDAALDDFTILGVMGTTDVENDSNTPRYALLPSQPNPAPGATRIGFQVPTTSNVEIKIFDVSGREVTTLQSGRVEAGAHNVDWNGTDRDGHMVASGVYYYRMQANEYIATRSLTLTR